MRVLAITLLVLAAEVAGGLYSGSLALLSDAGHMLADAFAIALAIAAFRFARRPATANNSFGFYRLEILAALANGILLSLTAIFVLREAIERLFVPHPINIGVMMGIATVGLIANLISAVLLHGGGDNLNMRGAYLHVVSDAASSLGVIVGALAIRLTGQLRIDAVVSAGIAVLILWAAVRLVREAANVLLEAGPRGIDAAVVSRAMHELPSVLEVHDLHIWSLTTGVAALAAHVRVDRESLRDTDQILRELNCLLTERFEIRHTTLQVESDVATHACPVGE